jgi:long-chain fatty acid transport protein
MLHSACRASVLAAALVLLAPAAARAAGFAIFEQGGRGMGFAGAFTAQASDPSAIFHNAAGIAFLKGRQVSIGGTLIAPQSDFVGANPFPGEGRVEKQNVGLLPLPAVYYTHALSEVMVFGVGVHVPFGLKTEWEEPDTFSGRFLSKKAELRGFSVNPTLAFKLADRLAIGGGVDVRFSSIALERNAATGNPFSLQAVDVAAVRLESKTKTGVGFNVGLLARPSENLSVGVAYRHKVEVDYDGTADFTLIPTGNAQFDALVAARFAPNSFAVTTVIEFPSFVSGGVAYSFGDWTVEADVNWYQWSSFDLLPIDFEGRPDLSSLIEEHYSNSLQYRLGIERRVSEAWSARLGYYFDESPAPVESVSPLLPDADRHGFALGAGWQSGPWRVDAASWYVRSKQRSTEGVNRERYNGTYKSWALTLGVSLGYSF